MDKIEYIEVNGAEMPLKFFPESVRSQVSTFEIVRGEYNKSVVNTTALGDYMQRLSQQIQAAAQEHFDSTTAKKTETLAIPAQSAPVDADVEPEGDDA